MKKVLLLDGYNLFYRARYSNMRKGKHSTIFNFFRSLRPLVEKFSPDSAFLVLEGMPKKRMLLSEDYKGTRVHTNEDNFKEQRREIENLLERFYPINLVRQPDFECDDIIGHLANKFSTDSKVTIVSTDTDFIQSIDENVELYNPVRKLFIEKFECNYVLYKALKGDTADNILGFSGIGDKTAKKLVKSKELMKEFLDKEGNLEKFKHNVEMIRFHQLNEEEIENINFFGYNLEGWDLLRNTFKEMEFKSMTEKDTSWEKYIKTFNQIKKEKYITC